MIKCGWGECNRGRKLQTLLDQIFESQEILPVVALIKFLRGLFKSMARFGEFER